jgi:hydrogenase maturation protease
VSTPRILVAGIGNIFLSDDGFGPEVVRRFAVGRPPQDEVRIVDYGIRGMHLAYDLLDGYDALVMVDAVPAMDSAPGRLTLLSVGPDDVGVEEFDAHGMNPVAVLACLGSLGGSLPPTYVIGCHPASVDEEMGLTPTVASVVDDAVSMTARVVDALLAAQPVMGGWATCASEYQAG